MARTQVKGHQIDDETIESVDIASGSIKQGELNTQAVSSQATIGSVDTTNDYLLIWDADTNTLKKVAPTNLGVGGSGSSPGGSDTQVQFNDGGSFAGDSGLTFNKTTDSLTIAGNITGSILYASEHLSASFVTLGTGSMPASGHVRLPSNASFVARNAPNTNDIQILNLDSNDILHIGDGSTNPDGVIIDTQSSVTFRIAQTYELALYPTYLDIVLPSMIFRNSESSPTLKQGDSSSTSKGETLSVQAQNSTAASSDGGNLLLKAGTGVSNNGHIQLSGSVVSVTGSLVTEAGTVAVYGSDGTDGQVLTTDGSGNLSFTTVSGGTTSFLPTGSLYSLVANMSGSDASMASYSPAFTGGIKFVPLRERSITGARLWTKLTSATDFKISLWDNHENRVVTKTSEIPTGEGIYEVTFDSAWTIPASNIGKSMYVSFYYAGSDYPRNQNTTTVPNTPFIADQHWVVAQINLYGSGDSVPTTGASANYMIEPVFATIDV